MGESHRVTVIGGGGIGSLLAKGLAQSLEFQAPMSLLQIVDGDAFEQKNAERQQFTHMGNKAVVLRADIQPLVPRTFVVAHAAWIVSEEFAGAPDPDDEQAINKITAESLMDEGDFVFCVVDNFAARKLVFDAARKFDNIDVFTGGNGSPETGDSLYGTVYHYQRRNGVDITAHPGEYHDEYISPPDRNTGEMSCSERAEVDGGTQLLAVNMGVASLLLAKAAHAIFGTEEEKQAMLEHSEIYFDMQAAQMLSNHRLPTKVATTV